MKDIAILGAGLAGSNLAAWLYNYNYYGNIDIYDPQSKYVKPCGNVFLPQSFEYLSISPKIANEIKEYEIRVNGITVLSFSFEKEKRWKIVDKESLIENMRNLAFKRYNFIFSKADPELLKRKYDYIVDARGPFSNNGLRKILLARGYFESNELPKDKIILDFDINNIGIFWAFPFYDMSNIGYGAIFERNPIETLKRKIIETKIAKFEKRSIKTSLLTIDYPPSKIIEGNLIRVGEAGGLVLSLGGEGNRLAAISSKTLADTLKIGSDITVYKRKLRKLYLECLKQAYVMSLMTHGKLQGILLEGMRGLSEDFYTRFLLGKLNLSYIMSFALKKRAFSIYVVREGIHMINKLFKILI